MFAVAEDEYLYMDSNEVQSYVQDFLARDSELSEAGGIQSPKPTILQDVVKLGAGQRKFWADMPQVSVYCIANLLKLNVSDCFVEKLFLITRFIR